MEVASLLLIARMQHVVQQLKLWHTFCRQGYAGLRELLISKLTLAY